MNFNIKEFNIDSIGSSEKKTNLLYNDNLNKKKLNWVEINCKIINNL